jgi:hypothetical protein
VPTRGGVGCTVYSRVAELSVFGKQCKFKRPEALALGLSDFSGTKIEILNNYFTGLPKNLWY